MSIEPTVPYCPVCGSTDALPPPAEGTCSVCYNHMLAPPQPVDDPWATNPPPSQGSGQ